MISLRHDRLDSWTAALEKTVPSLGDLSALRVGKAARFARLEALGLLTNPVVTLTVERFLAAPDELLARVPGRTLLAFVDPLPDEVRALRISGRPVPRDELTPRIRAASPIIPPTSLLTVTTALELVLNGNIIVDRDNGMVGEFVAGARSPSQQRSTISCSFERDRFLGTFRYRGGDEETRTAVARVISVLPGEGAGRDRRYRTGYYEVALGRDETTGALVPLFYDYNESALLTHNLRTPRA